MDTLLGALLCLTCVMGEGPWLHDEVEASYSPAYLEQATGELRRGDLGEARLPVSLKGIGHSNASYQRYPQTQPYFHHGIDMRASAGSPVIAAKGGKVLGITNYFPGDPAYWEIAIKDDQGFIWQYHHVRRDSIPAEVVRAQQTGQPIADGTRIGSVYPWSTSMFGEQYSHVHLNVVGAEKTYIHPMRFLQAIPDEIQPEILEIGLLQNGRKVSGNVVQGKYSLYAHIQDRMQEDRYLLPPHLVSVDIDGRGPQVVWSFDELPGGSDIRGFVNNFYVPTYTCGDYTCRRSVIDLGFTLNASQRFPREAGRHTVEVMARDFAGNGVLREFTWEVR